MRSFLVAHPDHIITKQKKRKEHTMSKIQGYQIIDIKISELPATGLAYLTALVEVKGCTFAASVKLDTTKPDPFTEARGRAVTEALRESERSDLALYGRHAPRPAGDGSWGKKGKTPTQCRKCGQDIILHCVG